MSDTTRDRLLVSGLFQRVEQSRDLSCENICAGEFASDAIRTVLSFDSFGDITAVESFIVDVSMRKMVAQNRKALGLPPQENP